MTRDDAKDVLIAKLKEFEATTTDYMKVDLLKEIILDETRFKYIFTEGDIEYLVSYSAAFEGYYEYPDVDKLTDSLNIEACRIPTATLNSMTSEQLVQAVFDFPFLYYVNLSSVAPTDTQVLKDNCDAYAELLTRGDAKDEFIAKIMQYEYESGTDYNPMVRFMKDIVLAESSFILNESEVSYLENDEINYEAFSYEMTMVGYTESSKFTDDALNAQYIG